MFSFFFFKISCIIFILSLILWLTTVFFFFLNFISNFFQKQTMRDGCIQNTNLLQETRRENKTLIKCTQLPNCSTITFILKKFLESKSDKKHCKLNTSIGASKTFPTKFVLGHKSAGCGRFTAKITNK